MLDCSQKGNLNRGRQQETSCDVNALKPTKEGETTMGKMMGVTRSFKGLSVEHDPLFRYCVDHAKDKPLFRRNLILTLLVFSTLILGFVDYATGHEFGVFVFYFLPIAIAAWKIGSINSFLISILSATVCFLSEIYPPHSYSNTFFVVWNSILRLVSFLIIAYFTSRIRFLLGRETETSHDHPRVGKKANEWIPICAGCKKIRDDKGHWQRVEEYLTENTNAQLTHGLCQECIDKLMKEGGIESSYSMAETTRRASPMYQRNTEGR
jgi:hypothetical protein